MWRFGRFFLFLFSVSVSGIPSYWFSRENLTSCAPKLGDYIMGFETRPIDSQVPALTLSQSIYDVTQLVTVNVNLTFLSTMGPRTGGRFLLSASIGEFTVASIFPSLTDFVRGPPGQNCTGVMNWTKSMIAVDDVSVGATVLWQAPRDSAGRAVFTLTTSDHSTGVFQSNATLLQHQYILCQPGLTFFLNESYNITTLCHASSGQPLDANITSTNASVASVVNGTLTWHVVGVYVGISLTQTDDEDFESAGVTYFWRAYLEPSNLTINSRMTFYAGDLPVYLDTSVTTFPPNLTGLVWKSSNPYAVQIERVNNVPVVTMVHTGAAVISAEFLGDDNYPPAVGSYPVNVPNRPTVPWAGRIRIIFGAFVPLETILDNPEALFPDYVDILAQMGVVTDPTYLSLADIYEVASEGESYEVNMLVDVLGLDSEEILDNLTTGYTTQNVLVALEDGGFMEPYFFQVFPSSSDTSGNDHTGKYKLWFQGNELTFDFFQQLPGVNPKEIDVFWSVVEEENAITIAVVGPVNGACVGFGFPQLPGEMVGSLAVVGWGQLVNGFPLTSSEEYYLTGKTEAQVVPTNDPQIYGSASWLNFSTTRLALLFSRDLYSVNSTTEYPRTNISLTERTPIIYAVADYPNDPPVLQKHYLAKSAWINFGNGDVEYDSITPAKKAHAVMMALGWGLFIPMGIFVARFRPFGANWIIVHTAFQHFGVLLGTIGFIVALSEFGTKREHIDHEYMGWTATVISWFQLVGGYLRPGRDKPGRWVWFWLHRIFGPAAFVIAYVNIYFGIHYIGYKDDRFTILVSVWIAIIGTIYILLQVFMCATGRQTPKYESRPNLEREMATRQGYQEDTGKTNTTVFHVGSREKNN